MCYGKEDGKRNKQKHWYKSDAVYSGFISLPRTHSHYRNNQARWRLGNAEISIVVTSNDGKKNLLPRAIVSFSKQIMETLFIKTGGLRFKITKKETQTEAITTSTSQSEVRGSWETASLSVFSVRVTNVTLLWIVCLSFLCGISKVSFKVDILNWVIEY